MVLNWQHNFSDKLNLYCRLDVRNRSLFPFFVTEYYEDGQDQENLNGENGEENDPIFKVPSLPPDNGGNGAKKKKLKLKGN